MVGIEGLKTGKHAEGAGDGLKPTAKQEKSEGLARIRIDNLDLSSARQLDETLAILKDPSNADHLADISPRTSLLDIVRYYGDPKRITRVSLSEEGEVLGIYDISGNPPYYVNNLSPEERPGVSISSAWLNRLCVKPDKRNKGLGSKLIEDAEKQALFEQGFPVLRGAIVLSKEQMDFYKAVAVTTDRTKIKAFLDKKEIVLHQLQIDLYDTLEKAEDPSPQQKERNYKNFGTDIFLDWFAISDERGRAFIKNRAWKFGAIYQEQTRVESTGENHPVLVVEKFKLDWDQEQRVNKRPRHKKVIDVAKRVPKGVDAKLL